MARTSDGLLAAVTLIALERSPEEYVEDLEALAASVAALRGNLLAVECLTNALVERLEPDARAVARALHESEIAAYLAALHGAGAAESTVAAFERHVDRSRQLLARGSSNVSIDPGPA